MKKYSILLVALLLTTPAFAKKKKTLEETFSLPVSKKMKTVDLKILSRQWSRSLKAGSPSKRYFPETSVPVLFEGVIYVGTQGERFYAIDANSGKTLWEHQNDEPVAAVAAITDSQVFFSDLGGYVVALDRAQGQLMWRQYLGKEILGQPAVVGDRLVLVKGEKTIVALNTGSGDVLWEREVKTFVREMTMRGHSNLVSHAGDLYVGLADGHVYRLDPMSGQILWSKNLTIPLRSFKDVDATVAIEGEDLYVGGYFGVFYKLNAKTGSIVWAAEIPTGNEALVLGDMVIVSDSDGRVHGLNKQTGSEVWFNELDGEVASDPVNVDGRVFVSTFKSNAYLLEPSTGRQVQKLSVGGSMNRPLVTGDQVVLLTNDAKLKSLSSKGQ